MRIVQKLSYFALGCLFVLVGQLLLQSTSEVRADEHETQADFETLTVRSLHLIDARGNLAAQLEVVPRGPHTSVNDVLRIFNPDGKTVSRLQVTPLGSQMEISGGDDRVRAMIGVDTDSNGFVTVFDSTGMRMDAMP